MPPTEKQIRVLHMAGIAIPVTKAEAVKLCGVIIEGWARDNEYSRALRRQRRVYTNDRTLSGNFVDHGDYDSTGAPW